MKDILNKDEFTEITRGTKTLVIFYQQWCGLCKQLIYGLNVNEHKFPNGVYYGVDVESDYEWYSRKAHLKMLYPLTRIYENNEIIYEISGLLYQTQIDEIINIIGDKTL